MITATTLEYELKRFRDFFETMYKNKHFAIMFKIKFPNGHVRSCSYVQISNTKEFDKLYAVFAYIFTLENFADKVSEEHNKNELFVDNYPKGQIVLYFKVLQNIKNTKFENFISPYTRLLEEDVRRDFPKDFRYKNFSIPAHMDLSI